MEAHRLWTFVIRPQCIWCNPPFGSLQAARNHVVASFKRNYCVCDQSYMSGTLQCCNDDPIVCPSCEQLFVSLQSYHAHLESEHCIRPPLIVAYMAPLVVAQESRVIDGSNDSADISTAQAIQLSFELNGSTERLYTRSTRLGGACWSC